MKEKFEDRKLTGLININLKEKGWWRADKALLCAKILNIVRDYQRQGYKLTLRQLYYQLVGEDAIPNHLTVYKKLGTIVDDLRYNGSLDWAAMEDRGRIPRLPIDFENVPDAIERLSRYYRLDRQKTQRKMVEVWTEKDAISGILYRVTNKYHVRLVVNKGYSSSTAMYRAYERFTDYIIEGREIVILYFGDHDPSGLDMVRDIRERILFFLCNSKWMEDAADDWWQAHEQTVFDMANFREKYEDIPDLLDRDNLTTRQEEKLDELFDFGKIDMFLHANDLFTVKHIGLTQDQIQTYDLPPNPAKMTDPRAKWYVKKFGQVSWEVDALKPNVMERLVESHIRETIDTGEYDAVCDLEAADISQLESLSKELNDEEE